ncbi:MAG TPA: zinc transporter ZupT [Tissierellaceae bacterium]|nr:zinc transporter ZupT [Tissierellaceae bacterium]
MNFSNFFLSFVLTVIAGLSMASGSLLSFLFKKDNKKFFTISLSFSAGIMIYLSFMGLLPEGIAMIEDYLSEKSYIIGLISFFAGIIGIALIERLIHRIESMDKHSDKTEDDTNGQHLGRLGIASAVAIAIHNLPEGLALFLAGLKDIGLATSLALAIIIHNIPLSIAISTPIYYSTKSKKKAFTYTLLVGLCQPVGALLGYLVFHNFFNDLIFGIIFAVIAGIMIFISLDELLPMAQKYDDHHIAIYGAIGGMLVMAISLVVFGHHQH